MNRLVITALLAAFCFSASAQGPVLEPTDIFLVRGGKTVRFGEKMASVIKKWGKPDRIKNGYSHTEDTKVSDLFYGKNQISFWWGTLGRFEIQDPSITVSKRGYRVGMKLNPNSDNRHLHHVNLGEGTTLKMQLILDENKRVIRMVLFSSH